MEYGQKYTDYQVNRSRIRHYIRNYYLKNVLKYVQGKSIDFGCGTGDLLHLLPEGSKGVDINSPSVEYCRANNMNAEVYVPQEDNYELKNFKPGEFETIIFSHVLEHIEDSKETIKKLFSSAERLNIKKIIVIVPGRKGYNYDSTHRTFINRNYIYENKLDELNGFKIFQAKYFPVNSEWFSKFFTHNELVVVYGRQQKTV